MAAVATTADSVTCGHSGMVATVGAPKLVVGAVDPSPVLVLVASGITGQQVKMCKTPTVTTSPPSSPCLHVLSVTPKLSLSTKLQVGGKPVVLATLQGTTDGEVGGVTPQTLLSAKVTQTLLTAT